MNGTSDKNQEDDHHVQREKQTRNNYASLSRDLKTGYFPTQPMVTRLPSRTDGVTMGPPPSPRCPRCSEAQSAWHAPEGPREGVGDEGLD